MNLSDIITKCYILALIIRDDGERLLLGDGIYEFKSSLQHFAPNIYQNDIVELQGTDGQLLAGQVRRSATQAFDGYIADGTIGKTDTEQSRRRFLGFFRKKHHYKVVYIMPDGTAVQRDRGYIVDAPAVQELYQRFPEYHIGLNFEDPNYYEYSENDEGEEIYTHIQAIALFRELEAGLVWDAFGAVSDDIEWIEYMTKNSTDGYILIGNGLPLESPLTLTKLTGNAEQKTLSGKNLIKVNDVANADQTINYYRQYAPQINTTLVAGQAYTFSADVTIGGTVSSCMLTIGCGTTDFQRDITGKQVTNGRVFVTFTPTADQLADDRTHFFFRYPYISGTTTGVNYSFKNVMLEKGSTMTDYEPYVDSIPSPNPSFPQEIKTVSGAQTVKITGKNIFDKDSVSPINAYIVSDGSIGASGPDRLVSIPVMPNTTYTITAERIGQISGQLNDDFAGALFTSDTAPTIGSAGRRIFGTATTTYPKLNQTFTTSATENWLAIKVANVQRSDYAGSLATIQLEINDQATPFEPYQGQSYEINLGGNLFDRANATENKILVWSNAAYTDENKSIVGDYISASEGQQFSTNYNAYIFCYDSSKTYLGTIQTGGATIAKGAGGYFLSFTIPSGYGVAYIRVEFRSSANSNLDMTKQDIMLNYGATALPYVPYTTYTYELCKIGSYQDYIWNDDGTWKIHKEVGKATVSLGGTVYTLSNGLKGSTFQPANKINSSVGAFCDKASNSTAASSALRWTGSFYENPGNFMFIGTSTDDSASLKAKYDGSTLYFVLATPTDTEITDSELIEQLNHIYSLYGGVNNLWLIPSAGAQGEMTVRFGVAYDDDGSGYHWSEELGSPDNIISNDGIDSVRPIWTINGPATNPTLTNITTAQTIAWNGTVPADSTLIIDMERQTATLNGANVYAQIEGDWLELAVGPNKLQYVASGGATADSTLEWNGVAG